MSGGRSCAGAHRVWLSACLLSDFLQGDALPLQHSMPVDCTGEQHTPHATQTPPPSPPHWQGAA